MRVVLALFAICAIAAACGKKVHPIVTTEMDLAILKDDGEIYSDHSVRKHELQPESGQSVAKATPALARHDYNLNLRESRFQTRIESEISVDLFEAGADRALVGRLIFKLMGKPISEYANFRETCHLPGDPAAISTCRIQSVILTKEATDALGNKTRVFKHRSGNYTQDNAGIRHCEIALDATGVEWRSASYVDADGRISSTESYKYALVTSLSAERQDIRSTFTVTCFKDQNAGHGKPDYRSVFRGVFRQNAQL